MRKHQNPAPPPMAGSSNPNEKVGHKPKANPPRARAGSCSPGRPQTQSRPESVSGRWEQGRRARQKTKVGPGAQRGQAEAPPARSRRVQKRSLPGPCNQDAAAQDEARSVQRTAAARGPPLPRSPEAGAGRPPACHTAARGPAPGREVGPPAHGVERLRWRGVRRRV
ncbi:uncharacterized protein LOC102918263 [Peromyscus maniculatus bairdii]|uniref:uncharacterized protein LOC102918263 n=1 Tax=Peromyscus maniculatus bairdii TaxID=230844 RepID=UPI003FD3102C